MGQYDWLRGAGCQFYPGEAFVPHLSPVTEEAQPPYILPHAMLIKSIAEIMVRLCLTV